METKEKAYLVFFMLLLTAFNSNNGFYYSNGLFWFSVIALPIAITGTLFMLYPRHKAKETNKGA